MIRARRLSLLTMLAAALVFTMAATPGYANEFDPLGQLPPDFGGGIEGPNGPYYDGDSFFTAPRCLAHEMSMPGQGVYISGSGVYISGSGVYISGSVRGLVLGTQVTITRTSEGTVTEDAIAPAVVVQPVASAPTNVPTGIDNYSSLLASPPQPDSTVGILVVDDFAGGNYALPGELWQSGLDAAKLEGLFAVGDLSHGALVMAHLAALIDGTGNYVSEPESTTPQWLQWHHGADSSSHLVVIPVDVSQKAADGSLIPIDTGKIRDAIAVAVPSYRERLADLGHSVALVINMSWVLLPCPTVADFMTDLSSYEDFADYVVGLTIGDSQAPPPGPDDLQWRLSLLRWVPPTDPLVELFGGPNGATEPALSNDVVLVAAAGNFDLRYQMLPAALPNVLGVGTPEVGQPQPEFSNDSDVAARGAWFHRDGLFSYAGTSFSAPLVSLFAAVDLGAKVGCVPSHSPPNRPGFGIDKKVSAYQGTRWPLEVAAAYCGLH